MEAASAIKPTLRTLASEPQQCTRGADTLLGTGASGLHDRMQAVPSATGCADQAQTVGPGVQCHVNHVKHRWLLCGWAQQHAFAFCITDGVYTSYMVSTLQLR